MEVRVITIKCLNPLYRDESVDTSNRTEAVSKQIEAMKD